MKGAEEKMKHCEAGRLEQDLASEGFSYVLLDFDHTLFLDNSTERFLDALRPRIIAYLLCAFSDWVLQVLAWFGLCSYPVYRDYMRVRLCLFFMPWSLRLWRRHAKVLARDKMNGWMLERLYPDKKMMVISFGFVPVIRPLLDHAGLGEVALIASEPRRGKENLRRRGKVAALQEHLPEAEWEMTLFVTDSEDDRELLETLPHGRLIQWGDNFRPAFHGLYLPFRYTVEGKYAGSRYFTYQILLEDLVLLFFAYLFAWPYLGALTALFASLYCIYEVGYHENDQVAAKKEAAPQVTPESAAFAPLPRFQPWLWSLTLAAVGFLFLHMGQASGLPRAMVRHWEKGVLIWLAILVSLRVLFWCFNRLRPTRRVMLFPLLHLYKTFSFGFFVPLRLAGVFLLAAQVIAISANYFVYRLGAIPRQLNRQAGRLGFFLLLSGLGMIFFSDRFDLPWWGWWALVLIWGGIRTVEHATHKNIVRILGGLLRPVLRKK